MPKHKRLLYKPALLQVMLSSEITTLKLLTSEAPSLISKPKSENSKTPTTDSKEMPTLLRLIKKEPELTYQLLKLKTKFSLAKSEDTKQELTVKNLNW